jgi:hypothetical protein
MILLYDNVTADWEYGVEWDELNPDFDDIVDDIDEVDHVTILNEDNEDNLNDVFVPIPIVVPSFNDNHLRNGRLINLEGSSEEVELVNGIVSLLKPKKYCELRDILRDNLVYSYRARSIQFPINMKTWQRNDSLNVYHRCLFVYQLTQQDHYIKRLQHYLYLIYQVIIEQLILEWAYLVN